MTSDTGAANIKVRSTDGCDLHPEIRQAARSLGADGVRAGSSGAITPEEATNGMQLRRLQHDWSEADTTRVTASK